MSTAESSELAIAMDGGGARAAYQVGFLSAVARRLPDLQPEILTGVSAGAINAAFLASRPGTFGDGVQGLAQLWSALHLEDVLDPRPTRLGCRALRWFLRLASGGRFSHSAPRSLVDNAPLRELLRRELGATTGPLPGIARNIERGALRAVCMTATSYTTGQSITFVQGRDIHDWERPMRRSRRGELTVEHVMASCALPFLFPAVELESGWYGDGGLRLVAPLAPAIHLGARRILAVSTRYGRSDEDADRPAIDAYPPPAQVAGLLLNALFLDHLDGDALRLRRLNHFLARTPPEERDGLRPIDLAIYRPSVDLGLLASEFESELPRALRFLARGTGTQETRSNDVLSLLLFQGDYVSRLIEIGQKDAEENMQSIEAFLRPDDSAIAAAGELPGEVHP